MIAERDEALLAAAEDETDDEPICAARPLKIDLKLRYPIS